MTGTFHSANWISAHLGPLAASPHCGRVRMVSMVPVPAIPNVVGVYPPRWLHRAAGPTAARLLTFAWAALVSPPDVVAGFHLLVNGLMAQIVAAAVGARSLYFCVGGPAEFQDGGLASENRYFERLGVRDQVVEGQLLRAALHFDEIVAMGTRAAAFFKAQRCPARVHVIGGAIDPARFRPSGETPDFDVVFVGRIVAIKRVDLLLRACALASRGLPSLRVAIVGDGPLRSHMEALARTLGIAVVFAGHQTEVAPWLCRARLFMLTSATEGVALSLMEAMTCGVPAIVSAVGDLEDLVTDGLNGSVVRDPTDESLAQAIAKLLGDDRRYRAHRAQAIVTAANFDPVRVAALWTPVLLAAPGQTLAVTGPQCRSTTISNQ